MFYGIFDRKTPTCKVLTFNSLMVKINNNRNYTSRKKNFQNTTRVERRFDMVFEIILV